MNGIEFKGSGVPRLPIIEPERVASPPLTITLSDVYRYELAGRETIAGTPCYIVAVRAVPARKASLVSRPGVDRDGQLRDGAGCRCPDACCAARSSPPNRLTISSRSRRACGCSRAPMCGRRTKGRRIGRPIHRVLVDDRLTRSTRPISPPGASGAIASENVMLRDTTEGYRYLKRSRSAGEGTVQAEPEVAGRANRVRTLAVGVILDPNISVPLPFAGLSYVDFDLFGTGTQLSAFFGGTYGQLAFSAPVAWRERAGSLPGERSASRRRTTIARSWTGARSTPKTSGSVRRRRRSGCCDR